MNEDRSDTPSMFRDRPARIVLLGPAEGGRSALAHAMSTAGGDHITVNELALPAVLSEAEFPDSLANAEAVVLTTSIGRCVDSALLAADAAEIARLIDWIEQQRGSLVLVSGLPLFIALTEGESLAKETDTLADWIDRLHHHIQAVEQRLQPLRTRRIKAPQPFGQVDLQATRATATQRPPAVGNTAVGFGIEELVRQCMDRALDFRRRRRQGARRLILASLAAFVILVIVILTGVAQRWKDTEADRLATEAAIDERVATYQALVQSADSLERFADCPTAEGTPVPWVKWYKDVEGFLAGAEPAAHQPDEKLPGADHATWAAVLLAEPVGVARVEWLTVRERLENRRDLVAALGVVKTPDRAAVLKFPANVTLPEVNTSVEELGKAYPRYKEWSLERLPRNAVRDLEKIVADRLNVLLKLGQVEVIVQLEKAAKQLEPLQPKETLQAWQRVRDWLAKPVELQAWRQLTDFLARLIDPGAIDPVDSLHAFLQQGQFEIELQRLVLRIPVSRKLRPDGKLTVFDGKGQELTFRQLGEPRRSGDTQIYTFVPEAGEAVTFRLIYRPGDNLWAELPVLSEDKQALRLTWSVCRSSTYQFERLQRPPRLHRPDQPSNQGELASDVSLLVSVGVVPRMPELLPVVRLGKR